MKTSFKDQYDNWYAMITIIASQFIINNHFFGHDLGFKLVFGFGPGLDLNLSARLQLWYKLYMHSGVAKIRYGIGIQTFNLWRSM